jgi:hypothetical protein
MAFTFFVRDEHTLSALLDHALPAMQGQAFIHVWNAGCAHGPGPYTLAILLRERMTALRKDGLLLMEHTQKVLQALRPPLEQVAPHAQVYRKIELPAANLRRWNSGAAGRVELSTDSPLPHRGTHHVMSRGRRGRAANLPPGVFAGSGLAAAQHFFTPV